VQTALSCLLPQPSPSPSPQTTQPRFGESVFAFKKAPTQVTTTTTINTTQITSPQYTPQYSVGVKVEGNYRNKGRYFTAKITLIHADGSYNLLYDDGQSESNVAESLIRALEVTQPKVKIVDAKLLVDTDVIITRIRTKLHEILGSHATFRRTKEVILS
jgi:hypothetical protein